MLDEVGAMGKGPTAWSPWGWRGTHSSERRDTEIGGDWTAHKDGGGDEEGSAPAVPRGKTPAAAVAGSGQGGRRGHQQAR